MQIDFSPNYSIEYSNPLRTHSKHLKSGNTIITDAPIDNHGKGEAFFPTDLLASSLVSCVMTHLLHVCVPPCLPPCERPRWVEQEEPVLTYCQDV